MSECILIVVAHPDDECYGMGGTIARLVEERRLVHVVCVGTGVGARGETEDDVWAVRMIEMGNAAEVLGVASCLHWGDSPPDQRFDSVPLLDIVYRVEGMVGRYKPTTVYTHHPGDLNIDHQLIARAVVTAARPYPGQVVKNIYGFEVPGSTEWAVPGAPPFVPTRFVPLERWHSEKKLQALRCYASEQREIPHPRSLQMVESLAMVRGSQCGYELAEAFTVIREVV